MIVRTALIAAVLIASLSTWSWAQPAPDAAPEVRSAERPGPGPGPAPGGEGQRPRPRRAEAALNPDGPDAPGPGPRDNDELNAEQIDEALAVLRDFRPEMASRIEEWRKDDPNRVGRMIAHQLPGIRRLVEARRTDPDGYKLRLRDMQLDRQTRQLANQVADARREGDAARAEELSRNLRSQVIEHFEVRQQMRERAVVMLEQRIKDLREQLKVRGESRDALIQDQMQRLMPSAEGAGQAEW